MDLFAERGYAATTVEAIAAAAGVSHMTFFRHFPTKEAVVTADLFDPLIASAVRAQPDSRSGIARVVGGLVDALDDDAARAELSSAAFRARIHLAVTTPELRAAVWNSGLDTQEAIAAALCADGRPTLEARAAAGAVMGAATAILQTWALRPDDQPATDALRRGLLSLLGTQP